jgi:hypothetical protein
MTIFLTFKDEAQAQEVLADYYVDGVWQTAGIGWALNVLGIVYDAEGNPLEGYGVNWSGELPESCLPFVVEIENPYNVFA